MHITEETLSDLTARVKKAYFPKHRHKVNNSWVLSQLENIDGVPFISLSRQYTWSIKDECLQLRSYNKQGEIK